MAAKTTKRKRSKQAWKQIGANVIPTSTGVNTSSDREALREIVPMPVRFTPLNIPALQRTLGNEATTHLIQAQLSSTTKITRKPRRNVASKPPQIQRDLMAYRRTWRSPGGHGDKEISASAAGIYHALEDLIKEDKVIQVHDGDRAYFSNVSATRKELIDAFQYYPRAAEMADALLDHHHTSLYSHHKIYTQWYGGTGFKDYEYEQVLEERDQRPLTGFERAEARFVFANSLDYDSITLVNHSPISIGARARAFPNTIYFESFEDSDFMELLVHELTHSWQYQRGIGVIQHLPDAVAGDYDYGDEAGLRAAIKAGKRFRDFNLEQQGDILEDYYWRLRRGLDVCPWLPFVYEVQGIQPTTTNDDGCLEIPAKIPETPEYVLATYKIPEFEIDSDEIPVLGEGILKQVATDLAANSDAKVLVEGYADHTGEFMHNLTLSRLRADSFRDALKDNFGIDPARVQTEGRGEVNLHKNWDTKPRRAHNRRVEITIIGPKT